ncbi:hypothetical protein VP01_453g7 [Puccinia sorghi]|uniref:Uncharacterized protein n=1 Tax=Puccinia sorghi TaxID=27349 RepID=A0A0L6UQV4_9BASI|nr:hypothetical protein VP01_453g7 [Puccinia sorghi]
MALDESERAFITDLVQTKPTIYLAEIQNLHAEERKIDILAATIANELHLRLNHSRKCIQKVNPQQDPDEHAVELI